MAYTEKTTVGYGSRVGSSFRAIGSGFLLFLAGSILLWWNEGRVVKTDKMLNEAESKTEELETIDRIDPEMDGKLVYAFGMVDTEDSLQDTQFGVGATAIHLKRTVEYYQYIEERHQEREDKLGGKEEITTTYTYKEAWIDRPVQSSQFHDPAYQNKNYVLNTAESDSWQAEKVTFGAFVLNENQVRSIGGDVPVELSLDSAKIKGWLKDVRQTLRLKLGGNTDSIKVIHVSENQLYFGINPSSPNIGDVRITWTKVLPARVTIIAKQKGNTFTNFKAKNGKTFSTLVMGVKDADEIYEGAHDSNHTLMWILRIVGIVMVIGGLKGIFSFIETVLKVVPFVANIIGWGVGMVCAVLGIVWSLILIAIAWLFYRPVLAIFLLAVAGLLVWIFAFKGKDKLKGLAARAKQQTLLAVLFVSIVVAMSSCGSKSPNDRQGTEANDSIARTDSLAAQTDGVEAAPADLWTVDAGKQHVRQMYDRLNENAAYINFNKMDEEFCTSYYLGLKRNIARHDANVKGDQHFMGDEGGYRWMVGVGAPLEIVMLEADLLAGNEARARIRFKIDPKFADEQEGYDFMILELWMENGRWRVNNFDAPEVFGKGGYLNMMETYARENNIPLEDNEEPTEGAPV